MTMRRDAGFTLLEMLVALVVFGLLMAGLSQTIRYGLTAWKAETRNAAAPAALAAADGALRLLLEQAAPAGFIGTSDQLQFTTKLPQGAGLGDRLADVTLRKAPGGGLVLLWSPHVAGIPLGAPPVPQTEVLLPKVAGLQLSYLQRAASGPPVWTDIWKSHNLPLLVRVHLQLAGQDWPDLVAAPALSGL